MLEGGRSIFQLALNKYPHAFQRPVTPGNIHVCSYVRSWAPTKKRGSAVRRCTRCGTAEWGEGGNNSFAGGIRTAKEEDVEDEEREGANGLEPELTNAKELSGISHLISRATRLRWYASRRGRAAEERSVESAKWYLNWFLSDERGGVQPFGRRVGKMVRSRAGMEAAA